MSGPARIQRQRTRGWRTPAGAVLVDRTSRWGTPYSVEQWGRQRAVRQYAAHLASSPQLVARIRTELAGKDLVCWCRLDQPCHADVLLLVANDGGAA